jgi:hypothetical protein
VVDHPGRSSELLHQQLLIYGLVNRTIGTKANILPLQAVTVRLRLWYMNALRWRRWLSDIGVVDHPVQSKTRLLIKYTISQLFG